MTHINDVIDLFLRAKNAALLSPKTVAWYDYELNQFFNWLQTQPERTANWLTPHVIERYLDDGRKRGLAAATIAGKHRALRGFFGWLVKRGLIQQSPIDHVPIPQVPKKEPRRSKLEEYQALLDSIPQSNWIDLRDRLAITVLFLCGLRVSEVANLRISDFNVTDKLLFVRGGKGDRDRFVPMMPAVCQAFIAMLYSRPVWPGSEVMLAADVNANVRGVIKPNGLRLMLRRRCAKAGVRYMNPHSFRHGLAMHLLNKGGDMSLVQKILGHSRISTTAEHYAEWVTDGIVREFLQKMGHG